MTGAPPPLTGIDVAVQVLYYLGLSSAVGVGLTVAVLTVDFRRGGILVQRVMRMALPLAVLVVVSAVVHVFATPQRDGGGGIDSTVLVQAAGYASVLAAMAWVRLRGNRFAGWALAGCALLTAVVPEMSLRSFTVDAVATAGLTIVHVAGALVWTGGLLVLALTGLVRPRRHRADAVPPLTVVDEWRQVWERFSVVAACAVGALLVSGAWLAWSHVGTPMQLLTTSYGRYLAIKLIIVACLIGAGAYNVRILLPHIRTARQAEDTATALRLAARHFPVVVTVEALLITAVLAVVPFLRGSARGEASWPDAGPFDLGVFTVGVVLAALVAGGLWAGTRKRQPSVTL